MGLLLCLQRRKTTNLNKEILGLDWLLYFFLLHFLNFSEFQNGDIIASRKAISNEVWLSIMPPLEHMQLQF